jgi:hypothetical protein
VDVAKIQKALKSYMRRHKAAFAALAVRETALLEMGALVMASEHYRISGYRVAIENAKAGVFNIKLTSRGHPYNFSWFTCARDEIRCEIHSNLAVAGAHSDGAVYVVDVAVVESDVVPKTKPRKSWKCLANKDLITFIEVKKLVIYPMLLAQFVGIVHEIKPKFLRGAKVTPSNRNHFNPSLISLGYLQGTSRNVVNGFSKRKYGITIVPSFDVHLSSLRRGAALESPFVTATDVI